MAVLGFHGAAKSAPDAAAAPPLASQSSQPRPHATATPVRLPPDLAIPHYPQGTEPFDDGQTLVYKATWEGVPAGEARITMNRSRSHPECWTGEMRLASSPLVDKLYRMRDLFTENFSYDSWQPIDIEILQHEKQRKDRWKAYFDRPNRTVVAVKTNRAGKVSVRRFSGGDPWGPFSGAMMALSQPLAPGQNYTFDIFSGGNRYVFNFVVQRRERIKTRLGIFNTLRIEPTVLWLSDKSFRSEAHETTVWVSDDARHLPLRVESAVFIGAVDVDLTEVIQGGRVVSKAHSDRIVKR